MPLTLQACPNPSRQKQWFCPPPLPPLSPSSPGPYTGAAGQRQRPSPPPPRNARGALLGRQRGPALL